MAIHAGGRALSRPVTLVALSLGAVVVLAACGDTGYTYVKVEDAGTFFKIPEDWRLFDQNEAFAERFAGLSPQEAQQQAAAQRLVSFDASPDDPSASPQLEDAQHPKGYAQVRILEEEERDAISRATMRNLLFPVDEMEESLDAQIFIQEDLVEAPLALHGIHQVFNVRDDDGSYFTVDQTTLLDPSQQILWLFVIGCEAECYEANQAAIEEVVDSLTIQGEQ